MMRWHSVRDRYRVRVNPLLAERRIEFVILLLGLLLILQLVYGGAYLALLSTPDVVLPAADSLQVASSQPRKTITSQQSNEIRDRPLLWVARRPVVASSVSAAESPKPAQFKGFKLVGLFGTGDSVGIIATSKGKTQRLGIGEILDEWTLESVGVNEAVFSSGSRQETLVLQPASIIISADKAKKP
jgi:hypothetical protein